MSYAPKLRPVFSGAIASSIKDLINGVAGATASVDQHQSNGLYALHQLRVKLEGDDTVYRVIVAPANAPIHVGTLPVDKHFMEPVE